MVPLSRKVLRGEEGGREGHVYVCTHPYVCIRVYVSSGVRTPITLPSSPKRVEWRPRLNVNDDHKIVGFSGEETPSPSIIPTSSHGPPDSMEVEKRFDTIEVLVPRPKPLESLLKNLKHNERTGGGVCRQLTSLGFGYNHSTPRGDKELCSLSPVSTVRV